MKVPPGICSVCGNRLTIDCHMYCDQKKVASVPSVIEQIDEILDSLGCPRRNPSVIRAKANIEALVISQFEIKLRSELEEVLEVGTKREPDIERAYLDVVEHLVTRLETLPAAKDNDK